ncbi:MAG: hypothetical protein RMI45_00565 [Ignisphaera sp.]|nr:hypothetical protein [Ignisphaera sp.]MDW8084718.1 hypothetical protein [Ignisphaera sp.]
MVNTKRILQLVLHIAPLVVFWDLIKSVLTIIVNLKTEPLSLEIIPVVAGGASALLTALSGSTLLYSITIAVLMMPSAASHTVSVPWIGIVGLFAMLFLDSFTTSFRVGRGYSVIVRSVDVVKTYAVLAGLTLLSISILYYIGGYFANLISLLEEAAAQRISWMGGASHILRIVVVVSSVAVAVSIVKSVGSVVALFTLPSRAASLEYLKNTVELDVVFKPFFTRIMVFAASLAFYPVLLSLLSTIALANLTAWLAASLPQLQLLPVLDVLFNIVVFLIASHIISRVVGLEIPFRLTRGRFVYAVALLLLIYTAAVKLAVDGGAPIAAAITSPDFNSLARVVATSYTNYAHYILNFVELLSRFLGVAP